MHAGAAAPPRPELAGAAHTNMLHNASNATDSKHSEAWYSNATDSQHWVSHPFTSKGSQPIAQRGPAQQCHRFPAQGQRPFCMQGQPAHKHRPITLQLGEPRTQGQPASQASTSWCGTHTHAARHQCQLPAQGQQPIRMQGQPAHRHRPIISQPVEQCIQGQPAPRSAHAGSAQMYSAGTGMPCMQGQSCPTN